MTRVSKVGLKRVSSEFSYSNITKDVVRSLLWRSVSMAFMQKLRGGPCRSALCHCCFCCRWFLRERLDLRREDSVHWKKVLTVRRSECDWEGSLWFDSSLLMLKGGSLTTEGEGEGATETASVGLVSSQEAKCAVVWFVGGAEEVWLDSSRPRIGLVSTMVSSELFLEDPPLLLPWVPPPLVWLGEEESLRCLAASLRRAVASRCSAWTAICRGDKPCSFFSNGSAPAFRRSLTTSAWP